MNYSKKSNKKHRKKIRSNAAKSKKKIGFNIFRFTIITILIVVIIGIAAAIGGFKGVIDSAPEINVSDVMPSKFKSTMYYPDGTKAIDLVGSQSNRTLVSIDAVPDALPKSFIAIEDERFYEHNGIDPKGIVRALFVGVTNGNFSQGASTITQQLIKLTVFDGGAETDTLQRFKRKFQEWYLALELEKQLSKDEILEAYMNTINLGRGAYGVEAAAERYFNKHASELNISECAVLAAIAQSPYYNEPIGGQQNNSERRDKILNNMKNLGFITEAEYNEAIADNVYARIQDVNQYVQAKPDTIYSWFEDAAIDQILKDLQDKLGYSYQQASSALYSGGLQIYLTQNRHIQDIVDRYYLDDSNFPVTEYTLTWALTYMGSDGTEVNVDNNTMKSFYGTSADNFVYDDLDEAAAAIAEYKADLGVTEDMIIAETPLEKALTVQNQSSFVLMDQYTGHVLALAGGRGEKTANRSYNRATQATRQPGSVFKVLAVFLPGIDSKGLTLASTKDDAPYTTPNGYQPFNFNANSYSGITTLRDAITYSMNVVTTKWLVEDVTPTVGVEYLQKLGFTTVTQEDDAVESLGLGGITTGITNFELTGAFSTIANGGTYIQPILYTKILDRNGNVLLENVPEKRTVIKDTTAWLLTSAMEDVVKRGTGTSAEISNYGIPVAGKTGTTNEYKDLWFAGFTPYYTACIWFGYDNSVSMRGRIRSNYMHETLWRNIMQEVHDGYEPKDFTMPNGIERATICAESGLLASNKGCTPVTEYFASDGLPTEYCDNHIPVEICSEDGLLATENTPKELIETKYFTDYDDIPTEFCTHVKETEAPVPESPTDHPDNNSPGDSNDPGPSTPPVVQEPDPGTGDSPGDSDGNE